MSEAPTDPAVPPEPRLTSGAIPQDTLGILSIVAGVLGCGGCFGTFVPYIGVLFMMASMALCVAGLAAGAVGIQQRNAAQLPADLSKGGVAVNGLVMGVWILYWLFVMALVVFMMVGMFAFVFMQA